MIDRELPPADNRHDWAGLRPSNPMELTAYERGFGLLFDDLRARLENLMDLFLNREWGDSGDLLARSAQSLLNRPPGVTLEDSPGEVPAPIRWMDWGLGLMERATDGWGVPDRVWEVLDGLRNSSFGRGVGRFGKEFVRWAPVAPVAVGLVGCGGVEPPAIVEDVEGYNHGMGGAEPVTAGDTQESTVETNVDGDMPVQFEQVEDVRQLPVIATVTPESEMVVEGIGGQSVPEDRMGEAEEQLEFLVDAGLFSESGEVTVMMGGDGSIYFTEGDVVPVEVGSGIVYAATKITVVDDSLVRGFYKIGVEEFINAGIESARYLIVGEDGRVWALDEAGQVVGRRITRLGSDQVWAFLLPEELVAFEPYLTLGEEGNELVWDLDALEVPEEIAGEIDPGDLDAIKSGANLGYEAIEWFIRNNDGEIVAVKMNGRWVKPEEMQPVVNADENTVWYWNEEEGSLAETPLVGGYAVSEGKVYEVGESGINIASGFEDFTSKYPVESVRLGEGGVVEFVTSEKDNNGEEIVFRMERMENIGDVLRGVVYTEFDETVASDSEFVPDSLRSRVQVGVYSLESNEVTVAGIEVEKIFLINRAEELDEVTVPATGNLILTLATGSGYREVVFHHSIRSPNDDGTVAIPTFVLGKLEAGDFWVGVGDVVRVKRVEFDNLGVMREAYENSRVWYDERTGWGLRTIYDWFEAGVIRENQIEPGLGVGYNTGVEVVGD